MSAPKVFVSSTCYDLAVIRTELRSFIEIYGFEPVMSEYSDFLFDYREHIHSSCLEEIPYCDMLILIIGGRYGAKSVPQALDRINIEGLKEKGLSKELLKDKENLSITQLEFLQSIYHDVPVFSFVSSDVMSEYYTWERNKENGISDKIIYPSIEGQETAKYIFEFINFIHFLNKGNSITTFSKLDEIKNHLRKQWAASFQRFLREQRIKDKENVRLNYLLKRINDIETAVFTSISSADIKETVRGINKYRDLINFLHLISRGSIDFREVLIKNIDWAKLMKTFHVDVIVNTSNYQDKKLHGTIIILEDGTYFQTRYEYHEITKFIEKWEEFHTKEKENLRLSIVEAVLDDIKDEINLISMIYYPENYLRNLSLQITDEDRRLLTVFWESEKFIEESKLIKGITFLHIGDFSQNMEVFFEKLIRSILIRLGINIVPGDHGIDIIAYKGAKKIPIEVKYSQKIRMNVSMATSLVHQMKNYMDSLCTDESIVVIPSDFSRDVLRNIKKSYSENGIHIIIGDNEEVLLPQLKNIFGLV